MAKVDTVEDADGDDRVGRQVNRPTLPNDLHLADATGTP